MKFTGDGHVELRPPKNLDDLKAYTSMALSLQRPQGRGDGRRRRRQTRPKGDMFVLYLGNRDVSASRCASDFPLRLSLRLHNLRLVAHQELHRHGPEEQHPAWCVQAQRHRVWDENRFHHLIRARAGHLRPSGAAQVKWQLQSPALSGMWSVSKHF